MATIIVNDVPENVVKFFWNNISYNNITYSFLPNKIEKQNKDFVVKSNIEIIEKLEDLIKLEKEWKLNWNTLEESYKKWLKKLNFLKV